MNRHRGKPKGWRLVLATVLCCGISTLWMGCSEQKNYKLLSFFFDGVPDPNLRVGKPGTGQGGKGGARLAVFTHKPYAEDKCQACHTDKSGNFLQPGSLGSVNCLGCHEKVPVEHAFMHGPVVAGMCLWCHNPHEASNKELLRTTAATTCMQCHESDLLSARVPEHKTASVSCLECHFGHGGSARNFLKQRPAPATLPTTLPSSAVSAGAAPGVEKLSSRKGT